MPARQGDAAAVCACKARCQRSECCRYAARTEDAVEKPLAKVGLVGTVTRLRGFRQDIIDERAGVVGAHVVVEETGAPVLLVVRLKVVADKLTEIELVAARSRAEGLMAR
jgi:hypothetical protein